MFETNIVFNTPQQNVTLYPVCKIEIATKGRNAKKRYIRALPDIDSGLSFITCSAAQLLPHEVKEQEHSIEISTINGTQTKGGRLLTVKIPGRNNTVLSFEALEVQDSTIVKIPKYTIVKPPWAAKMKLADDNPHPGASIDLLVGTPVANHIITGRMKPYTNQPNCMRFLIPTIYGYALSGVFENYEYSPPPTFLITKQSYSTSNPPKENEPPKQKRDSPTQKLVSLLEQMWQQDEFQLSRSELTVDEELAIKKLEESLTYDAEKQRYTAKLLFRQEKPKVVNNYYQALQRLHSTLKNLSKKPEQLATYKRHVEEFIDKGYLEPVEDSDPSNPTKEVVYLGHRMVRKANKDRLVIDPSMPMRNNLTLNEQILIGPPLQEKIHNILLNFRIKPIAVTGDVQSMYLMINLHPDHRDYTRFLWRDPGSNVTKIYRFTSLSFGFSDAPYTAQTILKKHARQCKDKTTDPIQRKACDILLSLTYVDDISFPADNPQQAFELYTAIQKVLASAGFTGRKWISNSPEFMARIPETLRGHIDKNIQLNTPRFPQPHTRQKDDGSVPPPNTATLGTKWNPRTDTLSYHGLTNLHEQVKPTMTSIASLVGKVGFDSLGLISALVIPAKSILKEAHDLKLTFKGKNSNLPTYLFNKFEKWAQQLQQLDSLAFKRHVPVDDSTTFHCFCDASSEVGFGAAIYARTLTPTTKGTNKWESNLLIARARIKPSGPISVPRLELKALLLGVQLAQEVMSAINARTDAFTLYSDSTVVLYQLRIPIGKLRQYEANRIRPCIESGFLFRKIPTDDNPADIFSRGATVAQTKTHMYQHGPKFLLKPESEWPKQDSENIPPDFRTGLKESATVHAISQPQSTENILSITLLKGHLKAVPSARIRIDNYCSTYRRLITLTATVYKALSKTHNKKTLHDFAKKAVDYWTTTVQQEHFREQISLIRQGKPVKKLDKIRHLTPAINENGHLCLSGRLQQTSLPDLIKYPILLPNCRLSYLIIKDIHDQNYHATSGFILGNLELQYWILAAKTITKQVQRDCFKCKKLYAKKASQLMGNLPPSRASQDPPFTHVSLDYFGPIDLKPTPASTTTKPYYVMVYRCSSTLGIALDLVFNRTSEEFLLSFKRMTARFGLPYSITSDNAPEFKKADKDLQLVLEEANKKIAKEGEKYRLDWHYIPANCSSQAGFHEVAVRDAKRAIVSTIAKSSTLSISQMMTVLAEVSSILSDRPIAKTDDDSGGYITPNDLLLAKRTRLIPHGSNLFRTPITSTDLNNRLKSRQALLHQFWSVWKKTYLKSLQVYHKWETRQPVIYPGQLVLLESALTKKHNWDTYVIDSVKIGRDGLPRSACLRRNAKEPKPTKAEIRSNTYRHTPCEYLPSIPLSLIYPLETQHPKEALNIYNALESEDTNKLQSNHKNTAACCKLQSQSHSPP